MQAEEQQAVLEQIERETPQLGDYERWLRSKEWKELRLRVLKRDNYVCQACRSEDPQHRATTAHHLTMRYGFAPPLWCLVAVCASCHSRFRIGRRRDPWMGKSGGNY
jgi:5-methylcytosine-specific restriction protein A